MFPPHRGPSVASRSSSVGRSRYRSSSPGTSTTGARRFKSPRFIHEGKLFTYNGSVFDKLQDPSLFTGTHKLRFDESGKGRGLFGRDAHVAKTSLQTQRDGEQGDAEGSMWASSLRAHVHCPSTITQEESLLGLAADRSISIGSSQPHRSVSGASRSVSSGKVVAPRFESWVMDANGMLVRDEQRTFVMNHGPSSRNGGAANAVEAMQWSPEQRTTDASRVDNFHRKATDDDFVDDRRVNDTINRYHVRGEGGGVTPRAESRQLAVARMQPWERAILDGSDVSQPRFEPSQSVRSPSTFESVSRSGAALSPQQSIDFGYRATDYPPHMTSGGDENTPPYTAREPTLGSTRSKARHVVDRDKLATDMRSMLLSTAPRSPERRVAPQFHAASRQTPTTTPEPTRKSPRKVQISPAWIEEHETQAAKWDTSNKGQLLRPPTLEELLGMVDRYERMEMVRESLPPLSQADAEEQAEKSNVARGFGAARHLANLSSYE